MAKQLIFDLPARPALGRDAFFVSQSNQLAVAAVDGWRDWAGGKLLLIGQDGSGKTHLAHVWAAETGAQIVTGSALSEAGVPALMGHPGVVVEDAAEVARDAALERALFHLHNLALAEGVALLLTATRPATEWGLSLPDLASRAQATQIARLEAPDDALLAALFVKLFADRQLAVSPRLVDWLVRHTERSFAAAQSTVARLDEAALRAGKTLSRDFARTVLRAADGA